MKFKRSHTVDQMINSAMRESSGYFALYYPGSNEILAVQVQMTRWGPKVVWLRKPELVGEFVTITRSAAIQILDVWRGR